MAKEYDDTNRGMLFRVGAKESDRHPDLNGRINIDGVDYWLSGWFKKHKDKEGVERTGVSLALGKRVESKSQAKRVETQREGKGGLADMKDDIPF